MAKQRKHASFSLAEYSGLPRLICYAPNALNTRWAVCPRTAPAWPAGELLRLLETRRAGVRLHRVKALQVCRDHKNATRLPRCQNKCLPRCRARVLSVHTTANPEYPVVAVDNGRGQGASLPTVVWRDHNNNILVYG